MAVNAGHWLDLADRLIAAGDLVAAANVVTDLRSAMIIDGLARAVENPDISYDHKVRLHSMAVATLDATVTNLKARTNR